MSQPIQNQRPPLTGADLANTQVSCQLIQGHNSLGQPVLQVVARENLIERIIIALLTAGKEDHSVVVRNALKVCDDLAVVYNSAAAEEIADQKQLMSLVKAGQA
jgi:hypothetical protein